MFAWNYGSKGSKGFNFGPDASFYAIVGQRDIIQIPDFSLVKHFIHTFLKKWRQKCHSDKKITRLAGVVQTVPGFVQPDSGDP